MSEKVWCIGLTGGIGCGKSEVGQQLEQLGLRRLDTDRVARQVVEPESEGLANLVEQFGSSILDDEGSLDRQALARIVFSDPTERKRLESILHPLIWARVRSFLKSCRSEGTHAVVEVPLLYEKGREGDFDSVWVVSTKPALQQSRLMERNGWSAQEIASRLEAQLPLEEKVARADVVIENNGDLRELRESVQRAWSRFQQGKDSVD